MSTPAKIDLKAYFPGKRLMLFALTVGKIVVLNSLKCMCNKKKNCVFQNIHNVLATENN